MDLSQHPTAFIAGEDWKKARRQVLTGDVPSPIDPPAGCSFHPRCPEVVEECRGQHPQLIVRAGGHACACHMRPWPGL